MIKKRKATFALVTVAFLALAVAIRYRLHLNTSFPIPMAATTRSPQGDTIPPSNEIQGNSIPLVGSYPQPTSNLGTEWITIANNGSRAGVWNESDKPITNMLLSEPYPVDNYTIAPNSLYASKGSIIASVDLLPYPAKSDWKLQWPILGAELDYKANIPMIIRSNEPITYYVSKEGLNTDGRSWTTAWNELDQIKWDVVGSGDTILIDGGAKEMVYSTTLSIEKKGAPTKPITIALASEPGRDGRVVIFGGRSTPLPYCGQTDYTYETAGVREDGIFLDQASWIVIDGRKWSGIVIYGHNRDGIRLYREWKNDDYPFCEHITFRGLEIFDNGYAEQSDGVWQPDNRGVNLSGRHITFEQTLIHDNGQDAIGAGMVIEDIILRRVWLYNQRSHPIEAKEPWNYCTHSDGIQVYGGGNQYGLKVEDSIIGPGFMQGLLLGEHRSPEAIVTTVNNVTISNTLLLLHNGESANANLLTKYDPNGSYPNNMPTGYMIDNCTLVRDAGGEWYNIAIQGSGHKVTNSVFYGGLIVRVEGNPELSNNYWWEVTRPEGIGIEADPMFADDEYAGVGADFADFDFKIQNPDVSGAGTSITSPDDLFGID